jgi:hypothetical protein
MYALTIIEQLQRSRIKVPATQMVNLAIRMWGTCFNQNDKLFLLVIGQCG